MKIKTSEILKWINIAHHIMPWSHFTPIDSTETKLESMKRKKTFSNGLKENSNKIFF